ncbi:MAG: DHHW family protein [Eubacteriales bacterium]|nr:DHHW family protein [Eubacteriales bacterium]
MKRKNLAPRITAVVFLLLLGFLTADNLGILLNTAKSYLCREISFADVMNQITAGYQEDLKQEEPLISLNGAYMRLTGARVSNGVVLMKNGMLTEESAQADPSYAAGQITGLYEYLQEQNTPFLFVEAPRKPDLSGSLMPEGTENCCHENANGLLKALEENGVPTLDLRPELVGSEEALEQYFYRTDHHWNAEGAFVAFQRITERMQAQFPEDTICSCITQRENWEKHVLKDYFLGSHGRRVGIGFAGVENFLYLTPKFDTQMSCTIPGDGIYREGSFAEAALNMDRISGAPDYYNSSPYDVHTGENYAHVQFRCETAPSGKKVLMIKDSYGLPLEGFLATAFREVETLDLRYLEDSTAVEIIEQFQPDMVIVMYNPFVMEGECLQFGLDGQ